MIRRGALPLIACAVLAACSGGHQDLERWAASVDARKAAPIEPIPRIAAYDPYSYRAEDRRTPFTPTTPQTAASNSGLTPDLDRTRDPLETFPLDALNMVGTISRAGATYALIQAPDNVVHRATRGEHIGQNYGEITAISDAGVMLTEIVPDGNGGYVTRPAAIAPSR